MNKSKYEKGISLITLVIIIVVIVILTGAIVLSISNNNPIKQASEAMFRNDLTTIKEQYAIEYTTILEKHKGDEKLIEIGEFSSNIIPGKYKNNFELTTSGIAIKTSNMLTEEEKIIAEEIFGIIKSAPVEGVTIPEGFYYVGGTKETGIVISDNVSDKNKGDAYEVAKTLIGNQYVWVPIESESEFVRREWNKGRPLVECAEPYTIGYSTETAEYGEMKAKVISNQGFYIARYEASNNSGVAESKALKNPWNHIVWNRRVDLDAEPMTGTASYEGRHASEKLGYTSVQSTLIYAVEWDNVLKFIENKGTSVIDSRSWGNYSDTTFNYTTTSNTEETKENNAFVLIPTGATERHMKQNISDIAGNLFEWTMEVREGITRICRGGSSYDKGAGAPAAFREYYGADFSYNTHIGFRVALYVK